MRAYLNGRDSTPLLRLYAQDIGYDYSDYRSRAASYSDGLYFAVACTDYPQLFNPRSDPRSRAHQLDASITALPASTFAPFTTREWISVLPYTETYTGCVSWPTPTHATDAPVPAGVALDAKDVPVLILNGALDSLTPAAGGAHIATQIGHAATRVVVPGMVHLVGLDDRYGCGSSLVRQFLRQPQRHLDLACTTQIPRIHTIGVYPSRLADAQPAQGHAPATVRRAASVALAAVGDAATRFTYVDTSHDLGLRGGRVSYAMNDDESVTATLRRIDWTDDSAITGTVHTDSAALAVHATITVKSSCGSSWTFKISWHTTGRRTVATIDTGSTSLSAPAP